MFPTGTVFSFQPPGLAVSVSLRPKI